MRLITAHRILIACAIALFLFYAGFQLNRYLGAGGGGALVQSIVSTAVAVGLAAYYRTLRTWGRR